MRATRFIDGIEVPHSGYGITVQWYTQWVVGIFEYAVEGNVPIMKSNRDLFFLRFNNDLHQAHRSRTYVPRGRTIRSTHIKKVGLLTPDVNLNTSK